MKKNKSQLFMQLLIMLSLLLVFPAAAYASDIQLDGSFADWEGQASMSDSYYDAFCPEDDIIKFSWATNANDDNLYFMLQNRNQNLFSGISHYNVHIDTNDNGQYGGNDYYLAVDYYPFSGLVTVSVFRGNGHLINQYSGHWGAIDGSKCEFYVSMDDIGLYPAQSIRMYAHSWYEYTQHNNHHHLWTDRVPDSGDIQWSPIPILGKWVLGAIFILALVVLSISIKRKQAL